MVVLRVQESECVDCGLPCIGTACKYYLVTRYLCDECEDEPDNLYYFNGQELCIDCIEKQLERVEYYE